VVSIQESAIKSAEKAPCNVFLQHTGLELVSSMVKLRKKPYIQKNRYIQKKRYIWHQRWHLIIVFT